MSRVLDERLVKWREDLEREKRTLENQLRIAEAEIKLLKQRQQTDENNHDEIARKEQRFLNYKETKLARLLNIDVLLDEIEVNRELRS